MVGYIKIFFTLFVVLTLYSCVAGRSVLPPSLGDALPGDTSDTEQSANVDNRVQAEQDAFYGNENNDNNNNNGNNNRSSIEIHHAVNDLGGDIPARPEGEQVPDVQASEYTLEQPH